MWWARPALLSHFIQAEGARKPLVLMSSGLLIIMLMWPPRSPQPLPVLSTGKHMRLATETR